MLDTGEVVELDRNAAFDVIDRKLGELVVREAPKTRKPQYPTRQIRPQKRK